jgi:hypothetical protein
LLCPILPFPSSFIPPASHLQHLPRPSHPYSTKLHSTISLHDEAVLSQGDIVGEGISLQGEVLHFPGFNQSAKRPPVNNDERVARRFEVIRKLGTGSYAAVYLVREVFSRSSLSEDDHIDPLGLPELGNSASMRPRMKYGREYTVELIFKAKLNEEELLWLLTEVCFRCFYSFCL